MPFLGAETALGCIGGRQVAISLPLGHGGQNRQDFWGRRFRAILGAWFLPASGGRLEDTHERNRLAVATTITGGFFVETVPKRYLFGTGGPRKWLDLV
jgi:hypothetical protein